MDQRIIGLSVGLVAGIATSSSCLVSRAVEGHCVNQDGDDYCRRKYPDGSRDFCVRGSCDAIEDGCASERPEDDACYSPCGGMLSLDEDPGCQAVADDSSSSQGSAESLTVATSETEPTGDTTETVSASGSETSSTGPSGCVASSECTDPTLPICVEQLCVACTDAPEGECGAKDAAAPACRDDGQCVQCTAADASGCGDTTPVCDDASSACVGCSFHEQCAATACDIATGACFDDACVVEVDDEIGGEIDYDDIGDAMMDGCVVIVHELDGEAPYVGSLEADGISVALLAADGEQPVIQGTGGNPSLSVTGEANLYIEGLRFRQNTDVGISAVGASFWLDRSEVVSNDGGGVTLASGAYARLRNCFIGGANNQAALQVSSSSMLDAVYTTLGGAFGASPALACSSPTMVTIRNSIMVAQADEELDCDEAEVSFSATEQAVPGPGNVALGTLEESTWFGDYDAGDFSLDSPPASVLTTAAWLTGDPLTDIDGDARPEVDESPDVAGADIP